jgi:predicted small lipoprotein YifL
MKKLFKNTIYLILVLFSLSACQSVKDGLTGKKKSNSDEFLVKKKNPLVLPPEFDKLPKPKTLSKKELSNEEEIDLKSIITKKTIGTESKIKTKKSNGTLEKSILEKIKSN